MLFLGRTDRKRGVFSAREKAKKDRGPKIATMIVLTIFGFLLANVVLAAKTTIPELTRASGEIIPQGHFLQIESAQPGIVSSVLVREGQSIEVGQVLAVLSSAEISQALKDTKQEIATVEARLGGVKFVLQEVAKLRGNERSGSVQELVANSEVSMARVSLFAAQQAVQVDVVESLRRNVVALKEAAEIAQDRVQKRAVKVEELEALFEKRLVTARDFEERRGKFEDLQTTHLNAQLKLVDARRELQLAQATLAENSLSLEEEFVEKLFELNQSHVALKLKLSALEAQAERLKVRSPAKGTLHSISFPSPGEVIELGETLFEILPHTQDLVAEIRIGTNDIGHIKLDDPVSLKLDTFDPRRYGKVSGKIVSVSPKILVDGVTGEEYFRATVVLSSDTIGQGQWQRDIRAGMSTSAEIVTSERTMMAYLLKPIQRSFESAFGER